ncbi:hypothetical protein [Agrococcus baldri]|uniref:Uncharacterized protein n=1 Tax=Agrococcus baldri TaxID=153730 RepID=A0AA87RBR5_9MICO|nr:hypothetical protein [Agrococcus baldri]GEK80134.1 hypothetical protein ABA31_14850 [Agrococcus baldri]
MSALTPVGGGLFGSTSEGRRPNAAVARQTRREVEQIGSRVEIEATAEQGRAFLTAMALTNVATLVAQAEAHMKIAPGGAQFYESIIASYAINAGRRIGNL